MTKNLSLDPVITYLVWRLLRGDQIDAAWQNFIARREFPILSQAEQDHVKTRAIEDYLATVKLRDISDLFDTGQV